ncbi:MAG: radical SAM protein, partial [Nanoarchaeota archaeon]
MVNDKNLKVDCSPVKNKVPITETLEKLLNPDLFRNEPIFTSPLQTPKSGEKVYELLQEDIDGIKKLRGSVVDLHPGMGGISPNKLIKMINEGIKLTSLDYMLTKGCNFECTWCFAASSPLQKEHIPFSLLESITKEAYDLGVNLFVLTGGEPLVYKDDKLGKQNKRGEHFFKVVEMIKDIYKGSNKSPKLLTFDDVALITPKIAKKFAENEVGLCTKGDTLIPELQDYKVNQVGAFKKMQEGYKNLINEGYGKNPKLRV